MKTLALVDGDLMVSSGSYVFLSGGDRIRQDLALALREHYGSDAYHPQWGSIVERFVGDPLTPDVQQRVVAEVSRVVRNYITAQAAQINADTVLGTRSTLSTADVVSSIQAINVNQDGDNLIITVRLVTMSGESVTIGRTVIA